MIPKPTTCDGCAAASLGQSYVPGRGPLRPRAILMGQGPGSAEAMAGQPFVGPSGAKLDRWLARSTGWRRDEVWVDNVVRCALPKNREPSAREVAHCRAAHWGPALSERLASRLLPGGTSAVLVVGLGGAAARALLGPTAGEGHFGTLLSTRLQTVTPSQETARCE